MSQVDISCFLQCVYKCFSWEDVRNKQTPCVLLQADFHLFSFGACGTQSETWNPWVLFTAVAQSSAAVLPVRSVTGTLLLTAQQILCKCVCVCGRVRWCVDDPYKSLARHLAWQCLHCSKLIQAWISAASKSALSVTMEWWQQAADMSLFCHKQSHVFFSFLFYFMPCH